MVNAWIWVSGEGERVRATRGGGFLWHRIDLFARPRTSGQDAVKSFSRHPAVTLCLLSDFPVQTVLPGCSARCRGGGGLGGKVKIINEEHNQNSGCHLHTIFKRLRKRTQ